MNTGKMIGLSILLLALMIGALSLLTRSTSLDRSAERLVLYCAAGIRAPVRDTIAEYERYYQEKFGTPLRIEVEFAGSGTLLSRLMVESEGDLFLAGDASYIRKAQEQGLVEESLALAKMTPVLAISREYSGRITSIQDLIDGDYMVAIGIPEGTAIGEATRRALERAGMWDQFEQKVGVTKPTVNDLAADVKIGAADAAIIWDITARQFEIDYITDEMLSGESALVEVGILSSSNQPTIALHFARFLAAPEKGLRHFNKHHFDVVDGDRWADTPEINFFSGALNRRALEPIIEAFAQREGARVNTVYLGCGALNAQMATIRDQDPDHGFPDAYLACDVYYLDPVSDWFEEKATVSSTRMVIVTQKDNPHNIRNLNDLANPGIRIVVGHPTHCTIGGLTERLFHVEGIYDAVMRNVVEKQPSSGMMVPPVVSGAADASIAYYNDTLPERDRLHVVEIDSPYARAVQPFGIAASSNHKHLMMRLYRTIGQNREVFEGFGFGWELGRSPDEFELVAPAGARPMRLDGGRN